MAFIGLTIGDVAGIGPEIVGKALRDLAPFDGWTPIVFGHDWVWENSLF